MKAPWCRGLAGVLKPHPGPLQSGEGEWGRLRRSVGGEADQPSPHDGEGGPLAVDEVREGEG